MRKSFLFIAVSAVSALGLAGCSVEEITPLEERQDAPVKTLTVDFTTSSADTKTAFTSYDGETYPVVWTAADSNVGMSLNYATPVSATVTKDADESREASISATFEDNGAPYQFFAFSPASAAKAVSGSRSCWAVTIPTVQTPRDGGLSCDESAMLIYAHTDEMQSIPNSPIGLTFKHVTAYCRLVLKNIYDAFFSLGIIDPTVTSIDITYSVPVAGDWYVEASDGSLTEKDASHTITLKPTIADLSEPGEIWFALAPCVLDGQTVKVTVNTDAGMLSRSYTFGTRTYDAGSVNKLSLDFTKNAEFTPLTSDVYELVNSISDLSNKDEVIVLDSSTDPAYGMSATPYKTNGMYPIKGTDEDGFTYNSETGRVSLVDGSGVAVWTVGSLGTSTISLKSGDEYLSHYASSPYYAVTSDAKATLNITITDGASRIYYRLSNSTTDFVLWFNDKSYFNFTLASDLGDTKSVALFKKVTINNTPEDEPILQKTSYGAYLSDGETIYTPGTCQLSRQYNAISTTFAVAFPADNTVLEFNGIPADAAKGDSFELIVNNVVGKQTTTVGTYNVTVVKEEGAKLWLSDFDGNGFIVKR